MERIMNQGEALSTLIQAANIAQSKGAYSLQEAAIITQAIGIFTQPTEVPAMESAEPQGVKAPTKKKKTSDKK